MRKALGDDRWKIAAASTVLLAMGLAACSTTVGSREPDVARSYPVPAAKLAACVFEALDKAAACGDGLKYSNYENSGEARITCTNHATVITSGSVGVYSLEFVPSGEKVSTVRFWGMTTAPGISTWADKTMPVVEACATTSVEQR